MCLEQSVVITREVYHRELGIYLELNFCFRVRIEGLIIELWILCLDPPRLPARGLEHLKIRVVLQGRLIVAAELER